MKIPNFDLTDYAEALSKKCTNLVIHIEPIDSPRGCEYILEGALDNESAAEFRKCLQFIQPFLETGDTVIIDLKKVPYICSMGIGAFTMAMLDYSKIHVTLKLRSLQPTIQDLFKMLGMLSYFPSSVTDQSGEMQPETRRPTP